MSDLLVFLDEVIDELQPDAAGTSREKWRESSIIPVIPAPENGTGTPKPLKERGLPVLPVVPVTKQDIYGSDAQIEKKTDWEISQKSRPHESLSKSTGSTGSTGSFEGFCGQSASRANDSHGKSDAVTGSFEAGGGFQGDENSIGARDERAAIVELGAGVPRAWAEGYAALCVTSPPAGFLPARWQRIIDAAGVFLDRWATKAAACGWSDLDVFGCDPTRPDKRFDCMGLLLLDRREIVGIDEHGADVVKDTGDRLRYRRRPLPPNTVSLWDLAPLLKNARSTE